jgi:hypothetical protein
MSTYDKASLVLIPSGTKEGIVFSQKPTNGDGDFTFTRASSATRVNSDGLIEKETQNLLLQSNTFDTTWIASGTISATSGQSGYDGNSDAWLLTKSTAYAYTYQNVSSGLRTISVYAKAGSLNWLYILKGGNSGQYFNLASGVLGGSAGASPIDANITSVGGGWYRCSLTYIDGFSGSLRIYPADGDGDVSGTSGSIYIQDAQLNQGLVADSYLETTTTAVYGGITDNIPRLDYTDASCPSLKLEPQRTNLVTNSEYVLDYGQNTADITLSTNLSPEGVKNCWRVEGTASGLRVGIATFSAVTGQTYTGSVYVRKISGSDTATITDIDNNSQTINITTEWQRFSVTKTAVDYIGRVYVLVDNIGDVIEVYGFQLEESSYPTSYIPTYGASVTFASDGCEKTSASDLIGQTEGTILCEINVSTKVLPSSWAFSLNDGTTSNYIGLRRSGSSNFFTHINVSGTTSALIDTGINNGIHKIAIAYASNDIQVYVDGSSVGTDTSSGIPSTSIIELGDLVSNRYLDDSVKQFILFKTRLSNEELADLTTI